MDPPFGDVSPHSGFKSLGHIISPYPPDFGHGGSLPAAQAAASAGAIGVRSVLFLPDQGFCSRVSVFPR